MQNTSSFTLDPSMSTLRNYTWALTTLCTGITTSRPTKNTLFARGTLVFGATASGNHFYRLPGLLERSGTRLTATIARAYVDDWIITDFPHAGDSAQQCISAIHKHKAIRIPLHACHHPSCPNCTSNPRGPVPDPKPKCKRRRPASIQELLGTICGVTYAHLGRVSYWSKSSRCSKILSFLCNAKETNHMTSKAAQ